MTDSNIQRRDYSQLDGRTLEKASAWLTPDSTSHGIEETPQFPGKGGNSRWDQFEANKRLFNVKNTFDENIYTSKLGMYLLIRKLVYRILKFSYPINI